MAIDIITVLAIAVIWREPDADDGRGHFGNAPLGFKRPSQGGEIGGN